MMSMSEHLVIIISNLNDIFQDDESSTTLINKKNLCHCSDGLVVNKSKRFNKLLWLP